jgi:hypothetical protein
MKIQLERNLKLQPHRLRCVACQHSFFGDKTRVLLHHHDGSIAGDVCLDCLDRGSSYMQQQLKDRAIELFKQPLSDDVSPSPHKQAMELWELATGDLVLPTFYSRWWQRLMMFVADTNELEIARRGILNLRSRQSKPHKITFLKEEPSIGKDN